MKKYAWPGLVFFALTLAIFQIIVMSSHARAAANPTQHSNAPWAAADWQATGPQLKLSPQEREFLVNLSLHIENETISGRIKSIIAALDKSPKLEQADYEFLTRLYQKLNGSKISTVITQIAEKYHP